MSAALTLSDAEKMAVIMFHQNQVESIKSQISELQNELNNSLYRISELSGVGSQYDAAMPLWRKVQFVLQTNNITLTTKEIAKSINNFEDKDTEDVRELVNAIGATLKPKIDKKDTFGRHEINGELFYGLIEWFDVRGRVKADYVL